MTHLIVTKLATTTTLTHLGIFNPTILSDSHNYPYPPRISPTGQRVEQYKQDGLMGTCHCSVVLVYLLRILQDGMKVVVIKLNLNLKKPHITILVVNIMSCTFLVVTSILPCVTLWTDWFAYFSICHCNLHAQEYVFCVGGNSHVIFQLTSLHSSHYNIKLSCPWNCKRKYLRNGMYPYSSLYYASYSKWH